MGDLFKALSAGLARFVFAWLMPSIITTGLFVLAVLPSLRHGANVRMDSFVGVASFTMAVLTLSVVFAYSARPIYQFLEGYTMPHWLARRLTRRMQRKYLRLKALSTVGGENEKLLAGEELKFFPETLELIMPTRLGNALKAMEGYGVSRFGLDSQTLWYELQSAASERLRRDTDDAQGAVDFFISSVAHLSLLAVVSAGTFLVSHDPTTGSHYPTPALVALAAVALVRPAYRQATMNVLEWRWAVQALVNTSRPALAQSLALRWPPSHEDECEMWQSFSGLVHYGRRDFYGRLLDRHRAV